jgi:hypothetical protein
MNNAQQSQEIDFTIDRSDLYREESITDLKKGSIRKLVPVKPDGSDDSSRTPQFVGQTQLMSPEVPLPLQANLIANTLEEAMDVFPQAMQQALAEMMESFQKMQREQQTKQQDDSRIIVPGR